MATISSWCFARNAFSSTASPSDCTPGLHNVNGFHTYTYTCTAALLVDVRDGGYSAPLQWAAGSAQIIGMPLPQAEFE